jgi:glutathione S-transferase
VHPQGPHDPAETKLPHEFVTIDFGKGEHKSEAHLARQPFGRIPTLDDDGFTMFESRAMCRYLNDKAGGKLVPADIKARAKMEQWISIETSEFTPHAMKFIYNYTFQRTQEPAVLEAAKKALDVTCAVMDKELAKSPHFAGAELSIAISASCRTSSTSWGPPRKSSSPSTRTSCRGGIA